MRKFKEAQVIGALYVASVVFSLGALNANNRQQLGCGGTRRDYAVATFFSLVPVANIACAFFGTGFLEGGWSLRMMTCGSMERQ